MHYPSIISSKATDGVIALLLPFCCLFLFICALLLLSNAATVIESWPTAPSARG